MQTKLSQVKKAYDTGDLRGALRIAARFHDLGDERAAITRAHGAFVNPDFYKQLNMDIEQLKELGRVALVSRYGFE